MSEPTDDNELKDFDLGAWEAPEPPDDLADGVIARLGGTEVGAAVPVEEPRQRHRALLIGGVAAAILAVSVGGYALVHNARRVAPAAGTVTADKAQALSLDGARADLDPGTEVKWSRQGRVLHVEQRKGTATWRVDTDEQLVIDAGATVASVEASGASLRVEVQMNPTDARIVGATAVTAAAVAMVTVVVYEGHVKVRDTAKQNVYVVEPGTRYTVTPPSPDVPVPSEPPVVGVGPVAPAASIADVMIDPGDSVIIHDPSPPTTVQFNVAFTCMHQATVDIDGHGSTNGVAMLGAGSWAYRVTCAGHDAGNGRIVVQRDPMTHKLPPLQAKNEISADGRTYRVTFQSRIPAIEVHGGPGTLHLAHAGAEQTFETRSESAVVPSTKLAPGQYTYWFSAGKVSTLVLDIDPTAPVFDIDAPKLNDVWTDQLTIRGFTLDGGTLSIDGIDVPVDATGRFMTTIPTTNRSSVPVRLAHPYAGIHYAILRSRPTNVTVAPAPCDEVSCVLNNYEGACCAKYKGRNAEAPPLPPAPDTLDRSQIQAGVQAVRGRIEACGTKHPASGVLKVHVVVASDGTVPKAEISRGLDPDLDECVRQVLLAATFAKTAQGGAFAYPFVFSNAGSAASPPLPANCDATHLKADGDKAMALGQFAASLAKYEASLRCTFDPQVVRLAFMASCNSANEPKATFYYAKLSAADRPKYLPLCTRNKIDPTKTAAAMCDADALKDRGMENINLGQHAAALALFEASLRCKDDVAVIRLAFASACNSGSAAKAKLYFGKLSAADQTKFLPLCVRNKVDVTTTAATASCDAAALKDKGMEEVNLGQHAAALALFEQSLTCKHDPAVVAEAFMAACLSQSSPKAKEYYKQLTPAQQAKLPVICIRNKVEYQDARAACDADDFKDRGMEAVNGGDHYAALGWFEKSLACKKDPYVTQLAFMASCNSQDEAKARLYYKQLKPDVAAKLKVMCDRQHVDLGDEPAAPPGSTGYLQLFSKPSAKILIDGTDTGLTTPVNGRKLPLSPGKHKVTLVVGDDRFTYPIVIRAGETAMMTKDLQ